MRIECVVSALNIPSPPSAPVFGARDISTHFAAASTASAGGVPDVELQIDYSQRNVINTKFAGKTTNAYYLNKGLALMLDAATAAGAQHPVGLVFADDFAEKPGIFGLMFTQAFFPETSVAENRPRTGAAVFVRAIEKARQAPENPSDQIAYTAIHEVGHLFNLWHIEDSMNLMKTSSSTTTYPLSTVFAAEHKAWLCKCSTERFVFPGGSEFEDWGTLRSGNKTTPYDLPTVTRMPLQLRIVISQPEFHHFEPVELDVTLGLARGARRMAIPDEIDPGYDRFDLWITEPDGERRLYRPIHRYCENPGPPLVLAPGRPFRRDISIFGGAGGFTFRKAGVHRIDAVLKLSKTLTVRSNTVEFEVKTSMPGKAEYRALAPVFAHPKVASLLFYRMAEIGHESITALTEVCQRRLKTPAAAGGYYAMARMFLRQADEAQPVAPRQFLVRQARSCLRAAARSGKLTGRRAERVEQLLDSDSTIDRKASGGRGEREQ